MNTEKSIFYIFLHGSVHVLEVDFGLPFIFSARHQLDTWTPAPRRHVVWRDSVVVESSRSGLKSECADIFHHSFLWLLRHTDEPQKGRNSFLWLQFRSVLSSFGVVLMSFRVNFHVVRSALQYSACRIWYVYRKEYYHELLPHCWVYQGILCLEVV